MQSRVAVKLTTWASYESKMVLLKKVQAHTLSDVICEKQRVFQVIYLTISTYKYGDIQNEFKVESVTP